MGLHIGTTTLWEWVQQAGRDALQQLQAELDEYERTGTCIPDTMSPAELQLTCLMGADGVFAPFRPNGGNPAGKTVWKEVKVGVITRLKQRMNRTGETVTQLVQRKLVAVLGDVSMLAIRLNLESQKQRIDQASTVVWLSDGGKWLWNIYQTYFAELIGILDFYHAVQNLWKGAAAWLDGRTKTAKDWFTSARHDVRHGKLQLVLDKLKKPLDQHVIDPKLSPEHYKIVVNAHNYLTQHLQHMLYDQFKQQNIPIGSGFVESACKWLIQQRFKCVGMRWSDQGFSNLLHLRLLWVNARWDSFFQHSPIE